MYFCPKCNFTLDISKTIINPNINEIISTDDFINLVLESGFVGITKLKFSKPELLKNKNFKKLSSDQQQNILNKYSEFSTDKTNDAFFICNNCNYHTKITSGTKIFETSFKENKITDDSLLNLRIMDNTLPRTKDFICPNENCNSHKKENEKTREAVFYRPYNNRYDVKYICSECVTLWNP